MTLIGFFNFMTKLPFLILDLLHDNKIAKSVFLSLDFEEQLNVDTNNATLEERRFTIENLIKNEMLYVEPNGYLALTEKGGKYWEMSFCVDWNLFFEFFGIHEKSYLYACNIQQIHLAIDNSNGLLDDCFIHEAKNWQPIYWKNYFKGFFIESNIDCTLLPNFYEILPPFKNLMTLNPQ